MFFVSNNASKVTPHPRILNAIASPLTHHFSKTPSYSLHCTSSPAPISSPSSQKWISPPRPTMCFRLLTPQQCDPTSCNALPSNPQHPLHLAFQLSTHFPQSSQHNPRPSLITSNSYTKRRHCDGPVFMIGETTCIATTRLYAQRAVQGFCRVTL